MKIEKPVAAISMVRNDVFFADKWISYYGTQFGYEKLYNTQNPFQWMVAMSIDGKTNFFEKRVGEYALAPEEEDGAFDFDGDF